MNQSEIKISDEARVCAQLERTGDERQLGRFVQAMLNQRDAELAELRKSERDLQSKVFELLREREALQAGVKGGEK